MVADVASSIFTIAGTAFLEIERNSREYGLGSVGINRLVNKEMRTYIQTVLENEYLTDLTLWRMKMSAPDKVSRTRERYDQSGYSEAGKSLRT